MKSRTFLLIFIASCVILLLSWCHRWIGENDGNYDEFKDIEPIEYSSNFAYDLPFVPQDIPENFSWDVVELKNYWITTKLWEIIVHPENIYYFTWTEPVLIRDSIHWIDVLLSKDFSKYSPRIFIYHDADVFSEWLWISSLVDWEYSDFNANSSISITMDKNGSEDIPWHFDFYGSWYLWKNNKYTFFLIDSSAMIRNLYYKDHKEYGEYLNNLFLWFKLINI